MGAPGQATALGHLAPLRAAPLPAPLRSLRMHKQAVAWLFLERGNILPVVAIISNRLPERRCTAPHPQGKRKAARGGTKAVMNYRTRDRCKGRGRRDHRRQEKSRSAANQSGNELPHSKFGVRRFIAAFAGRGAAFERNIVRKGKAAPRQNESGNELPHSKFGVRRLCRCRRDI